MDRPTDTVRSVWARASEIVRAHYGARQCLSVWVTAETTNGQGETWTIRFHGDEDEAWIAAATAGDLLVRLQKWLRDDLRGGR